MCCVGATTRRRNRPARVIIPLAVAAALLVGGSFAAWKFWPHRDNCGSTSPGERDSCVKAPSTAVSAVAVC